MAFIGLLEILLLVITSVLVFIVLHRLNNKTALPTNWPLIGMLPSAIPHAHCINEWATQVLHQSNCTFLFRGPWFSTISKIMVTVDPANIHYIFTTGFAKFPKGPEFKDIFDIYGDGIINSDYDLWKEKRKVAVALLMDRKLHNFIARSSRVLIKDRLVPILDHASKTGTPIDLQDLFQRFTFDSTCMFVTGFDPGSLSIELPEVPIAKAMDETMEAIFYRHAVPGFVWKLQRWLGVGEEKKLIRASEIFDQVIGGYVKRKREALNGGGIDKSGSPEEEGTDLLTSFMAMGKSDTSGLDYNNDRFLRDAVLSLLLAGRDTTSSGLTWFFYALSRNPIAEKKIREEIANNLVAQEEGIICPNSINKMVYLHGAICESLRLYPPVPWQHKRAESPDILPSGHRVSPDMRIMVCLYAMGRMPSIWGDDSFEFKPERWISDNGGGTKHEPSYKFLAFNAGPRTCLGKDVSLTQMKTVVAKIVQKFHFEVVECQEDARLCNSLILQMKNGLKVRVSKV